MILFKKCTWVYPAMIYQHTLINKRKRERENEIYKHNMYIYIERKRERERDIVTHREDD